mmetsp:Transcript_22559/g.36729  ORF Transcript_22559/g.36729 Transcript_22559/m.36729 type:complete len:210 (-) Transcript_22559:785-1414(-)
MFFAHVTEQRDLLALFVRNWLLGTTHQYVRCNTDGLQLLYGVLCRFGFKLAGRGQIGQQRQMHEDTFAARLVVAELSNSFKERQTFDVAHGAANFAEHEIDLVVADMKEVFDFVRDVRHHLNGFAKVVATAFFFQNVGVDPARADGIGHAGGYAGEAFVVAEIEIGFCTIVGDKHLAVFKRRHGAGIHVQVRVQFAQTHGVAPCLQQRS